MEPSEAFLAARDLIRERGWTRGAHEDDLGQLCLRGALRKAVTGYAGILASTDHRMRFVYWSLQDYINQEYGAAHTAVLLNDSVFTHEDEACEFLEGASKYAAGLQ